MRTQDTVIDTIKDILIIKFGFRGNLQEEAMDIPLTSSHFNFSGIQLYQLLMCIEEVFGIYFEPEDVAENGFFTLSDIQRSVKSKLYMCKKLV